MNQVVYMQMSGDSFPMRYELVKLETGNVYGSGRPAWGIKFKSDASRRLYSDFIEWNESSEAARDARIAEIVALNKKA